MSDTAITELCAMPEVRLGHLGPLVVTVWRGTLTEQSVKRASAIQQDFLAECPRITALGVVTESCTGIANPDFIHAAVDAGRRFDPSVTGTAVVVPPGSSQSTRAVVQGLVVLVGNEERYRIFGRIGLAMTWLWRMRGPYPPPLQADELEAVHRFVEQSTDPERVVAPIAGIPR